ncbi:uncharacterized protein LOC133324466 [Musca vetustissima]|uniref:uncharacterized protein LOC133324466 n=1 Tax=Musca vetustissima TaxID=27455 RepID=UPI002AB7DA6C|nr:uncharacterized protein LOC133324466 [Musca vetustissima]
MAGLIDKRKRSREDDVSCDSTPLSKRINNLHLSNFEEAAAGAAPENNNNHIQQHMSKEAMNMHHHHHHATAAATNKPHMNGVPNVDTNNAMYHPELNKSENPFYYDKNKLLHELHLERMKRCTV